MRIYWIMLMLVTLITGCSSSNLNYGLTEKDLEGYLGNHFSYAQEFSLPGMANLKADFGKLNVELGPNNSERIAVSGKANLSVKSLVKDIDASLTGRFSAIPWFDTEKGAIYLKGLEVDSVTIEPGAYKPLINPFSDKILKALRLYLEQQPVYVLDKTDVRQALALKLGQAIKVRPGKIDFVLGAPTLN